jgi:putative two-component system response regulator
MLQPVRPIVRHHHELLDGSGYPDGLKGDGIPLLAQVLGIVDVYDAVTTERPYKPALPAAQAYEELTDSGRRGMRRRDLIDEFIRMAETGELGGAAASQPA